MAGEYLDRFVSRIEDMAGTADDETETLVLALDVAMEARTLLRAVHGALQPLEEGIGNAWSAVLPGRPRA